MKSDLQIQKDVMNELKWQPFLKASSIGVSVKNGIVTLSGQVDTYSQKLDAEKAATSVSGVKAIAEDIQIGVSPLFKRTDTEIAESVVHTLKMNTSVPHEKIKVKVDDGMITLEGQVDWEYQRNSAKAAITSLYGVRNVVSLITVKPKVTASDVEDKIIEAFERSATIDADKISVDVVDSKVILRGYVRSFAEKADAEAAAWCAPGVSTVENYLKVEPEEVFAF